MINYNNINNNNYGISRKSLKCLDLMAIDIKSY